MTLQKSRIQRTEYTKTYLARLREMAASAVSRRYIHQPIATLANQELMALPESGKGKSKAAISKSVAEFKGTAPMHPRQANPHAPANNPQRCPRGNRCLSWLLPWSSSARRTSHTDRVLGKRAPHCTHLCALSSFLRPHVEQNFISRQR